MQDSKQNSNININSADKGSLELRTLEFMPTILLGLGGTGKEVLLRIRRQFVEKYGSLNDFPITSYLYIDTDNAPSEESGIARERDYLISEIDFQPSEKIFNPVNPMDYIQSIQDVPHIKSWLNTTGEIGKLGTMNTGAGQIRPAAKLAFYHNFDEIVSKLNTAKSRITDSQSINFVKDKHNIKNITTEKINVYIITSVSGGTGSGMFIDMGFLIRNLFRNQAISTCYIVLPKIFQGYGKERIYANSYSALKELEYYNFKNPYSASWKKNEEFNFQPGVFDDVYFIDGENVKNLSLSDISNKDIYKMISDTIFLDFNNSDFANYKRGVRVNLLQYKQRLFPEDNESSENLFSRKYSSLGQSTISIPTDRIILSCSYRLCKDIIDYYLTFAEGSQSDIDNYLINDFLPELGILEYRNKHQLLDSLYRFGEKSSLQVKVKEFLNNLQNELTEGNRGCNWTQYLIAEKQRFDTNFRDDNDASRKGLYFSQIHSNRNKIIEELIGNRDTGKSGLLEKKINGIINDSTRGVFYAINLLRRLQFILSDANYDYIPALDKEIKDLQSLAARTEAEVKRKIQDLREDESRSKLNILKKASMSGSLEKVIQSLDEYYNILLKLRARYYAKEICQWILSLIEKGEKTDTGKIKFTGLISDINKLTGNLGLLSDNFEKKYLYFSQKINNSFNLYQYEPEDIENDYYPKYVGTGKNANEKIKFLANDLLKVLGASNITDIVNIIKDSDAKAIEVNMIKYAKNVFEPIRRDFNVTDLLFEKDIIKSESKIRSMIQQSAIWLRINEIPGRFKLDDSAKKFYVGVKTNTESFSKLRSLVYSIAGDNVEFKDSADSTSIVFYSEWAGFPIFYSYTVSEDMKPYYNNLSRNHYIDLHNDKNYFKFPDIIPLSTEESKRLNESHRAYILGLIFGIFEVSKQKDSFTGEEIVIYKYTKQEGITVKRTEQLGIESRLILRLFEEKSKDALRYEILQKAESKQNEFINNGFLAELLVIFEYYYENIYKIEELELSGGAYKKIETYQYKIVRDLAKNIEIKIKALSNPDIIKKIESLKSNIDGFSYLCGDGIKRILKPFAEKAIEKHTDIDKDININKLRELKKAFEEGLISEKEFNEAKIKFLNK